MPGLTANSDQVSRYWNHYRLVLVTNTRDFVLVSEDAAGRPAKLESFRLADSPDEFHRRLEKPCASLSARLGRPHARAPYRLAPSSRRQRHGPPGRAPIVRRSRTARARASRHRLVGSRAITADPLRTWTDTQSCCGALIRPSPWPADVVSTRSVRPRPAARSSFELRVRIVRRAVAAVLRDREQVSHGAARLFPEPLLEVRSKCPRRSRPPAHVPRADRSEPPAVRP